MKEKVLNNAKNVGPYLLVTPIKDEVNNLEKLRDTVFSQTMLPKLWVIVDSGSSDGSYEFAKELFKNQNGHVFVCFFHVVGTSTSSRLRARGIPQ